MKLDLHAQVTLADVAAAGGKFLRWWGAELFALLPEQWRAAHAKWQERVHLREEGMVWHLVREGDDAPLELDTALPTETLLEDLAAAPQIVSRPLDVVLSPEDALIRRLDLPGAAVSRLRAVVALQIERLSPFSATDVAFDCRIADLDAAEGKATAEVCIVPRRTMRRYEDRLEALGLSADWFFVEGTPFRVRADQGATRDVARRKLTLAAAAIAALVWLGVGIFTPIARETELDDINSQIAELRPEAVRAAALQAELDALHEPARLAQLKAAEAKPIDILKALTATLPQTVRIFQLNIEHRYVVLTGIAKNAPSLIPLLEKSGHFSGARFRTPVTRRPDGNDRFELEITIGPAKAPAAGPA